MQVVVSIFTVSELKMEMKTLKEKTSELKAQREFKDHYMKYSAEAQTTLLPQTFTFNHQTSAVL